MAFPQDRLPVKQELLINGVWTDITSRTRSSADVVITRGYSAEQASLSSAQCDFTLNNKDGLFSNRNPLSTYYRQLGRNTQYRTSVTETTPWIHLRDYSVVNTGVYDLASVSTADKAVLDIVGDLDVRIDVELDNWRTGAGTILVGKYKLSGNQRSWVFMISRTGYLLFWWSQDGTALKGSTSTAQVPVSGRISLRATIDVDNGAGGYTVTFSTAPTISGTYTTLGSPVTVSGVTSIFSGSALLEIGNIDSAGRSVIFGEIYPLVGKVYTMELRSGIGGTLVAKMDATSRTPGDIIWSDGLGTPNTWQTASSAPVTNSDYRFWGEISKLPQRWDESGQDVYVPVVASDLIQRKSQGEKALESPIFRNLSQYPADFYAPLEMGAVNGSAYSTYTGRANQLVSGNFNTDLTLPGTAGVLTFSDDTGYISGVSDTHPQTSTSYVGFYFKLPSVPLVNSNIINFYYTGGNVVQLQVIVGTAAYTINVIDVLGFTAYTTAVSFGTGAEPNKWVAMRIRMVTTSLTTAIDWAWYGIGNTVFYGTGGSFSGVTGRPKSFISYPFTGKSGMSLAHVIMARNDIGFVEAGFYGSSNGYIGETPGARAVRLSKEELVPFWLVGNFATAYNETMGAQTTSTYLDLIKECADLAGGLLYSPRDKFGIAMRLRTALVGQGSTALSYTSKHFSGSMEPDEDDALIRNDVTVTRPNGGFGRVVKLTGSLNTGDPTSSPDSVGVYDTTVSLNASSDARLPALAGRAVFLGTWDELRYTKVQVQLERAPFVASAALTKSVRALDIGDPFTITGLPKWLPPDDVELLILGYTETLRNRGQVIVWNTAPYGPYRAVNYLTGAPEYKQRAAATSSTTAGTLATTATSMSVATAAGSALWSTTAGKPANFPYDIFVAGERMTVTAITGATSPQTFTVTRSINGVIKTHAVGETVQIVDLFYVTL